jgi:hypothetical protein
MVQWYMVTLTGYAARFNIQTSASSNDTAANVPIVFSYAGGSPSSVQARIVDGGGNPVTGFDWTDITASVQTVNGACVGYLNNVPAGVGYKRQVRVGTSGVLVDVDTLPFNIGCMILPWGQSNARGTMEGGFGRDTAVPGTAFTELTFYNANGTGAFFGKQGFISGGTNAYHIGDYYLQNGGGLAMLRLVGNGLQTKFGRKVGVAINPWDQNGQPMGSFLDLANNQSSMLANNSTVNGSIGFSSPYQYIANGDYRIVTWHQGESESSTQTRAARLTQLKNFCQAHINQVSTFGRPANKLTFLFALMGVGNPPQMEVLRGAVYDLVAYAQTVGWDVRVGWNCIDLDPQNATPPDSLHFGDVDKNKSIRRQIQSILNVIDQTNVPYGAAGPYLTGAVSRAGDDVTLTVAHSSGPGRNLVALNSGAAITGWYANTAADFSGTDIPLTNVTIVDATHVKVTATGAPTTFYIKHCGNKYYTALSYHPDVSNLIFDDFAYPTGANAGDQLTGLPLQPTPDAIRVG